VTDLYLHVPPGAQIRLRRFPVFEGAWRNSVVEDAIGVVAALWPFVRPLAADLWLGCRDPEVPFLAGELDPARKGWHVRERELPEDVEVASYTGPGIESSTVDELTPDALREQIETAVAQEPPEPSCVVTFAGLACRTLRARLLDDRWSDAAAVTVRDGSAVMDVPVERRPDGLWIVAPLRGHRVEPPVSYEVELDEAVLSARISVMWSQWSQPGSAEHDALQDALERIVAQGWEPQSVPDTFELAQPSSSQS
jgi:hypothetical protein